MLIDTTPAMIGVTFRVEGFHNWPDAPERRSYLAHTHRHLFHVEVYLQVQEDDREVEFHDLLDFARFNFPGGLLGSMSCEMMARELAIEVTRHYGRACSVRVSEDGEVSATVAASPSPNDERGAE